MRKEDAIKFEGLWLDIDSAVETLRWLNSQNKNVYIDFNGKKLFAMFDSVDDCYLKVTGLTEKARAQLKQKYNNSKKSKKERTEMDRLIARGKKIIYPQLEEAWRKCVCSKFEGVYKGEDVKLALEIMEALYEGKSFNDVYKIFSTEHFGGAQEPIINIITSFSPKGPNFKRWVIIDKMKRSVDVQTEIHLKSIEDRNQELDEELDERANEDE